MGEGALIVVILVALVTSDDSRWTGVVVGSLGSERAGFEPETPSALDPANGGVDVEDEDNANPSSPLFSIRGPLFPAVAWSS